MFESINKDLQDALKNGDKFKLSVLRMLKSALQLESINAKSELTDDNVITVIKRQVKQRKDSIKEYEELGKIDTVNDLNKEVEILNIYLPKEAGIEEINAVIDKAFKELNPSGMKSMGEVMKYVSTNLKNADMTRVSAIVKEKLSK